VLAALERDDPTFAADKLVRAMKGAAAFLNGDQETAGQELLRPMLDCRARGGALARRAPREPG